MERSPDLTHVEVQETVEVGGIQSSVKIRNDNDDLVTIGHVTFLDIEDTRYERVKEVTRKYLGSGFIFKSSPRNYHVINPVLRSMAEVKALMEDIPIQDDEHAGIGYSKGDWTLRATEKGDKDRPEFMRHVMDVDRPKGHYKEQIYSRPHLEFIEDVYGSDIAYSMLNEFKTIGDVASVVKYHTRPNNHELDGEQ